MNKTVEMIRESIANEKQRSAWDKGVNEYAFELLDSLEEDIECGYFAEEDIASPAMLRSALLNGAGSWGAYSWGGCSLCYDGDIAERLCTPSELKKTRGGDRRPNRTEEWLDVQGRALYQAANRICRHARKVVA